MESPASTLARRCAALMDADMRVAYVRHALREMPPGEMVALVAELLRRRTPAHADALLTVSLALGSEEVDAARTAAARRAAEDGLPDVVALLGSHEDATPELGELRVPDFGRGRPLTLGERKTLARRRDRQLLGRVLRDPHPDVIEVLLGNPALTEEDVVRLAATRPIDPRSLEAIYQRPRWAVRYRVRRALVQNPYCPLPVALRLVHHLTAPDARRLANAPDLRAPIREACARAAHAAPEH